MMTDQNVPEESTGFHPARAVLLQFNADDWIAIQRWEEWEAPGRRETKYRTVILFAVVGAALGAAMALKSGFPPVGPAFLGALLCPGLLWLVAVLDRASRARRLQRLPLETYTPTQLLLQSEGIAMQSPAESQVIPWASIGEVHATDKLVVFTRPGTANIHVPRRLFSSPAASQQFFHAATQLWSSAKGIGVAAPTPETTEEQLGEETVQFVRTLRRKDYVWLFYHAAWNRFRSSRKNQIEFAGILLVTLALFGGGGFQAASQPGTLLRGLIASAFLVAFYALAPWVQAYRYSAVPYALSPMTFWVSPQGVMFFQPRTGKGSVEWTRYSRLYLAQNYLVSVGWDGQASIVPLRDIGEETAEKLIRWHAAALAELAAQPAEGAHGSSDARPAAS